MNNSYDIIATLGPSSTSPEIVGALIDAGMTIARLNFSWEEYESGKQRVETVRNAAKERGVSVVIMQDLSGPRVQTSSEHHMQEGADRVLTEKDKNDLEFTIREGCEFVAVSYVRDRGVLDTIRAMLKEAGSTARIVAKIERPEALEHLEEIIDASDVVMVARGDLGTSIPIEAVPFVQHMIIEMCQKKEKPVIVATQMLLSMTSSPTPTRAEVSDVAYAIVDGAQAVMLSEETATGAYPVLAVQTMKKIIQFAQHHLFTME